MPPIEEAITDLRDSVAAGQVLDAQLLGEIADAYQVKADVLMTVFSKRYPDIDGLRRTAAATDPVKLASDRRAAQIAGLLKQYNVPAEKLSDVFYKTGRYTVIGRKRNYLLAVDDAGTGWWLPAAQCVKAS